MGDRGHQYSTRNNPGNNESEETSESGGEAIQASSSDWSHVNDDEDTVQQRPRIPQVEAETETEQEIVDTSQEDDDYTMSDEEETTRPGGDDPNANENTIKLGNLSLKLIPEGDINNESEAVKPLYPKDEWATYPPETRRKAFTFMAREILQEKLEIVTVTNEQEMMEEAVIVMENLSRIRYHLQKNDLLDIFIIGKFVNEVSRDPIGHVDMLKQPHLLMPQDVGRFNKFVRQYVDMAEMPWITDTLEIVREFVENNCSDGLNGKALEEYTKFPLIEQGGNLYLLIVLKLIYHDSPTECFALMNRLANLKVSDFPGEDVSKFVTTYRASLAYLKHAQSYKDEKGQLHYPYIRADLVQILLGQLTSTSSPEFNMEFQMFKTFVGMTEVFEGKDALVPSDADEICSTAESILAWGQTKYMEYLNKTDWKGIGAPGKSGFFSKDNPCWNCGETGHQASECPKPRNEEQIKKNRQAAFGRRSGGRGGRDSTWKWRPPSANEHNKRMIDGKLHNWNPEAKSPSGKKGRWCLTSQPGQQANSTKSTTKATTSTAGAATTTPTPVTINVLGSDASTLTAATASTAPDVSTETVVGASTKAARQERLAQLEGHVNELKALYTKDMKELEALRKLE